jgi:hypothetical protein
MGGNAVANEQGDVRVGCQGAVSRVDHPSAGEAGAVLVVAPADPVARRLQRMHSRAATPRRLSIIITSSGWVMRAS